jgi:hypothetical protein
MHRNLYYNINNNIKCECECATHLLTLEQRYLFFELAIAQLFMAYQWGSWQDISSKEMKIVLHLTPASTKKAVQSLLHTFELWRFYAIHL